MNEQHNGQKPEAPADRSSHLPDWCQSLPLYRLLVFISMFTVWSQLRIPAFFRHDTGAQHPLTWLWLGEACLFIVLCAYLIVTRARDRNIFFAWLPIAIGVLVLVPATGGDRGDAAANNAVVAVNGGMLACAWIASALPAHWPERKRQTVRSALIATGFFAALPVGILAGTTMYDAIASGSLVLY